MNERESLVYRAKVAEQAECYEEMVIAMKQVVALDSDLSIEERNLLSVGFKNVVGAKRTAWRIITSLEVKEQDYYINILNENAWKLSEIREIKFKIESYLHAICGEILKLLDEKLIPHANGVESKVFWYKMKGDYHRYIAEYERDNIKLLHANKALFSYQQAMDEAGTLKCTNPILLGLVLNFSVFYYEIMADKEKACSMAKKYFDSAVNEVDFLEGEEFKDTTLIMQLLKDNLALWTTADSDDGEESN